MPSVAANSNHDFLQVAELQGNFAYLNLLQVAELEEEVETHIANLTIRLGFCSSGSEFPYSINTGSIDNPQEHKS